MSDDLLALIVRRRRSGRPVTDILSLTNELDERAREAVRQNLPALMSRLVSGTHEVLVASEGWVPGAVMRAHAEAIVVRSGASVFMVERTVR